MKQYERETQLLLRQLGANGSYIGFQYIAYGVAESIQNPDLIVYISKGLYVRIASHFNTTTSCVERDIRTVKSIIWNYGDRNLLNQILGRELKETPNNAAFIDAIAHYVVSTASGH